MGNYDYKVHFELTDYPSVSTSIPLTINILRPPSLPITIQPTPKSSYTVTPGSTLLLSFSIESPQKAEIEVTVDTRDASAFTKVEMQIA